MSPSLTICGFHMGQNSRMSSELNNVNSIYVYKDENSKNIRTLLL
jgi:hypothetical protein